MAQYYYSAPVSRFLRDTDHDILGALASAFGNQTLTSQARNAWVGQISVLKSALRLIGEGYVYFEFAIPRMGKRADNILIIRDAVCVIEFKIGANTYAPYVEQVVDYSLDLKNFHKGSHHEKIFPVLVCTEAEQHENEINNYPDQVYHPIYANSESLADVISLVIEQSKTESIDPLKW